ncbi:MAG: alpha/beta fold hydrolase [Solirubrobacteraceae bacterium]
MRDFAASPTIMPTLHELVHGPIQEGASRGSTRGPVTIGWGRSDRVTLPRQAQRAQNLFPGARLHWFSRCGHFPHWGVPDATSRLILDATAQTAGRSDAGLTGERRRSPSA